MKYVLKEWLKMPKALILTILGIIFSGVADYINIIKLRDIASLFSMGSTWYEYMPVIVAELIAVTLFNVLHRFCRSATHIAYTDMFGRFTDKVIYSEFDMFVRNSCSKVISASEQMWNIANIEVQIRNIASMLIKVVMLLVAIYKIAPNAIIPIIVVYGIGILASKYTYKWYGKLDSKADKIKRMRNQELDECVNGFKELRGFCMEDEHSKRIHSWNSECLGLFLKRNCVGRVTTAVVNLMYLAGTVVGIIYCMDAITSGTMSLATAMVVISYIGNIIDPIFFILDCADELSTDMARLPIYKEVMEYSSPIPRVSSNNELGTDSFERAIEFIGVSFSYENTEDVLTNTHLRIEKGQKVGICGISGGGKTTIFNLLMDYYVPQDGYIMFDGVDYRKIKPQSIRKHIGIVNQDIHIFNDTIRGNIMYGKPDADESQLVDAAKKANIYEFIKSLPNGFETTVGPKGLKLSGGQRQRIGLARIFLVDPEIILLDEATAALDNESETIVQEALNAFKDKTIVTIAHRLSTIRNSDIIYVIDNHTVAEQGTHEQLMQANGVYARLNK